MVNLEKYTVIFDEIYPEYSDVRYSAIQRLVEKFNSSEVLGMVEAPQFKQCVELIQPLIAIKNYKSQIPFPEEHLLTVIKCFIQIKQTSVGAEDIFLNHTKLFNELIEMQGFQLPTVSAIFHFCHPQSFPIVDVNVMRACEKLKEKFPNDFIDLNAPKLPAINTSISNKLKKYNEFILFLNKILSLQKTHTDNVNYRYIDKALMVLGVKK